MSWKELIIENSDKDYDGHGDHWGVFAEDISELIAHYIPEGVAQGTIVTLAYPENTTEMGEPTGLLISWPDSDGGMMIVIYVEEKEKKNDLYSAFPWFRTGVIHQIPVEAVHLWSNRLEAQIETTIGDAVGLVFFDTLFVNNRFRYEQGKTYAFALSALAYRFEVANPESIIIQKGDKAYEAFHAMTPDNSDDSPITIRTKGMAAIFPREDMGADDYEFAGPVKEVTEFPGGLFGCSLWRAVVTVVRPECNDIDIAVFFTDKSLHGPLPKVGDDCRGLFWLQGYLVE